MLNDTDAMNIALRVLMAIAELQEPDASDIEELRRVAIGHRDAPLDELACDVIQGAIKHRTQVQALTARKHLG